MTIATPPEVLAFAGDSTMTSAPPPFDPALAMAFLDVFLAGLPAVLVFFAAFATIPSYLLTQSDQTVSRPSSRTDPPSKRPAEARRTSGKIDAHAGLCEIPAVVPDRPRGLAAGRGYYQAFGLLSTFSI